MNRLQLFVLFRTVMITILLLIQYYCFRRLTKHFRNSRTSQWVKNITVTLFILFNIPFALLLFWTPNINSLPIVAITLGVYPFYIWHFSLIVLSLLLLLGNIIKLPIWFASWFVRKIRSKRTPVTPLPAAHDERRRVFLRQGITLLAGTTFAGSTYGAFKKDDYELTQAIISIHQLPDQFHGFSIALISDIHSCVFMTKSRMDRYAQIVNSLNADLITVTGDFVNSQVDEVYPFAEAFSQLRAKYGVYGVLGNHDYYSGNVDTVAKVVEDCGIKLLINDSTVIEKNNEKIYLLGSDDVGTHNRAGQIFDRLLLNTDSSSSKILMCHRPYFFEEANNRSIDLVLSGHTHGGQVVFGKIGNDTISPARVASQYIAGLYSLSSSQMYVSRGIGTVGIPIRINCPPEITKITLIKA